MRRLYRLARRLHLIPDSLHEWLRRMRSSYDMASRFDTLVEEVNYLRASVADLKALYQAQQALIESLPHDAAETSYK